MITAALLAIPTLYLWAFSPGMGLLTLGAFMMSFLVTGCWSAIPAHLNELSPPEARGTFPGTVYQLGNVFASVNLTIQVFITERFHSYSIALASVAFCAAVAIILLVRLGPEAHNAPIGKVA